MNLKPYIAKQEQLERYRDNFYKLEVTIASYGGLIHAPLSIQYQYSDTKKDIERLEQEIKQIELQIITQIPTIRDIIKVKDEIIHNSLLLESNFNDVLEHYRRLIAVIEMEDDGDDSEYGEFHQTFEEHKNILILNQRANVKIYIYIQNERISIISAS